MEPEWVCIRRTDIDITRATEFLEAFISRGVAEGDGDVERNARSLYDALKNQKKLGFLEENDKKISKDSVTNGHTGRDKADEHVDGATDDSKLQTAKVAKEERNQAKDSPKAKEAKAGAEKSESTPKKHKVKKRKRDASEVDSQPTPKAVKELKKAKSEHKRSHKKEKKLRKESKKRYSE
mmetsp:Transcript_7711/g.23341  ORF Transcript_7711/g.23341 Transcript_7711/m.23341 type:complete len:180 (-) Transcript_7711:1667-2206(-)